MEFSIPHLVASIQSQAVGRVVHYQSSFRLAQFGFHSWDSDVFRSSFAFSVARDQVASLWNTGHDDLIFIFPFRDHSRGRGDGSSSIRAAMLDLRISAIQR